jgi:hypothetical protein
MRTRFNWLWKRLLRNSKCLDRPNHFTEGIRCSERQSKLSLTYHWIRPFCLVQQAPIQIEIDSMIIPWACFTVVSVWYTGCTIWNATQSTTVYARLQVTLIGLMFSSTPRSVNLWKMFQMCLSYTHYVSQNSVPLCIIWQFFVNVRIDKCITNSRDWLRCAVIFENEDTPCSLLQGACATRDKQASNQSYDYINSSVTRGIGRVHYTGGKLWFDFCVLVRDYCLGCFINGTSCTSNDLAVTMWAFCRDHNHFWADDRRAVERLGDAS